MNQVDLDQVDFVEEEELLHKDDKTQHPKSLATSAKWLIDKGFVKTQMQANLVIIVISIICFAVSFYLFSISARGDLVGSPSVTVIKVDQ